MVDIDLRNTSFCPSLQLAEWKFMWIATDEAGKTGYQMDFLFHHLVSLDLVPGFSSVTGAQVALSLVPIEQSCPSIPALPQLGSPSGCCLRPRPSHSGSALCWGPRPGRAGGPWPDTGHHRALLLRCTANTGSCGEERVRGLPGGCGAAVCSLMPLSPAGPSRRTRAVYAS